ncbi:MAG: hypothetical protein MJE77_13580 [Proteobacteria bacterium]|nr:hypothetical protein [Pseudomonadota bacterium]
MSRSGFASGNPTLWNCGWHNPTDTEELMIATAICLQPPDYGSDPAAGRIRHVTESKLLSGRHSGQFTASCDPEEELIAGSCMIDSNDPLSHRITMYYHGFSGSSPDDRATSNTWRCAWNNPTNLDVTATVAAVCVTPLQ